MEILFLQLTFKRETKLSMISSEIVTQSVHVFICSAGEYYLYDRNVQNLV